MNWMKLNESVTTEEAFAKILRIFSTLDASFKAEVFTDKSQHVTIFSPEMEKLPSNIKE